MRVNSDNLEPIAFRRAPRASMPPLSDGARPLAAGPQSGGGGPRLRLVGGYGDPWGIGQSRQAVDQADRGFHVHVHLGDAGSIRQFALALAGQFGDAGAMGEPVRSPAPRMDAEELATAAPPAAAIAVPIEPTLAQWRGHLEANKRDPKYVNQQLRAIREACAFGGVDDLANLTAPVLLRYRDKLLADEASGSKVNNQLASFRQFFKWAVRFEVLKGNPAENLENAPRNDGDGNREFTPEEAAAVIAAARADEASGKPQHKCIRSPAYILAWNTGLRHKEIRQLLARDFRGMGSADPYVELPWTAAKNRRATQIPLNPEAHAEMLKWIPRIDPRDEVFATTHAPGLPQAPHERVVNRDIKAAGIVKKDEWGAPVGFHSFRKGGATALASAGQPESVVAQFLRHSDPKLTRKVYIRLRRKQLGTVAGSVPNVDNPVDSKSAPGLSGKDLTNGSRIANMTASQAAMRTTQANPGISSPGAISAPLPENLGQSRQGSKGRVSPSDSVGPCIQPTPAIAGVGFESAPALVAVGGTLHLNLTISPEAAGAVLRALAGLLGGGQNVEPSKRSA